MGARGFAGVVDYGVADKMGKIPLEARRQPPLRAEEPVKRLGSGNGIDDDVLPADDDRTGLLVIYAT
jgi:hypothetical protein